MLLVAAEESNSVGTPSVVLFLLGKNFVRSQYSCAQKTSLLPQDKSLSIFLKFSLGGSEATIVIANQIRARCGVPHEYILCWQYRASCYVQMTKTNGLKRTELFGG